MLTAKGGKMGAFRLKGVSWNAKGVYGFMIFTKKDPCFTFKEIQNATKETRTATMVALTELEKKNLIYVDRDVYPYQYCVKGEEKNENYRP